MALTKYEQETHTSMNREDDYAVVDTSNARHIKAILADDRFTVMDRWNDPETGDLSGIVAHINLIHFDPLTGVKRKKRDLTDEERKVMGERLAASRAAKKAAAA